MNGWKRIAIVVSVLWILIAGFYTLNAASNADIRTASELTVNCEKVNGAYVYSPACDQLSTDYLAKTVANERIEAASVALIPVPLAWGVAYFMLFIIQWVRCGFEQPSRERQ